MPPAIFSFSGLIITLAFLIVSLPAWSGSFKAVPIRLVLDAGAGTAVLKVTNNGDEKVTVQLDAKAWSQDRNGRDIYSETQDIVFFPKMATIEKGEERIIRVGYRGKRDAAREKSFRLFLQELPVSKPGEMALKFALRLGIPIFIAPAKAVSERSIDGTELKAGRLFIKVKNSGNTHFIVNKIRAAGLDASGGEVFSEEIGGWYVLSGITKSYTIDLPEKGCRKSSEIKITVAVNREGMDAQMPLDTSLCKKPTDS